MSVLNTFNLTPSGTSGTDLLTQSLINQNPSILYSTPTASSTSADTELTNLINTSSYSATGNTSLFGGISNDLSSIGNSANQFLSGAQSWLNSYESSNNLPITTPNSTSNTGNTAGSFLSGLAGLVSGVGGILTNKNGISTAYASPYIGGQATTYNAKGQAINPVTGQPIAATQFPTTSILIIGGLVVAGILVMKLI